MALYCADVLCDVFSGRYTDNFSKSRRGSKLLGSSPVKNHFFKKARSYSVTQGHSLSHKLTRKIALVPDVSTVAYGKTISGPRPIYCKGPYYKNRIMIDIGACFLSKTTLQRSNHNFLRFL